MLSRQEFFALARGRLSTEELYSAYDAYSTCQAFEGGGVFRCRRCGACCRRPWRIEPSAGDVRRWIGEKRLDIIENLVYAPRAGPPRGPTPEETESIRAMCYWTREIYPDLAARLAFVLAASGEGALVIPKDAKGCAYFNGSGCTIYDTRPGVCARFPDARLFGGLTACLQQG